MSQETVDLMERADLTAQIREAIARNRTLSW
jgi:hypothetical protein